MWRRIWMMPDEQRARLLAKALACVIIVVLYALGGASLYLRAQYLSSNGGAPDPTRAPAQTAAAMTTDNMTGTPSPSATPTLYPTITPDLTKTAQAQRAS